MFELILLCGLMLGIGGFTRALITLAPCPHDGARRYGVEDGSATAEAYGQNLVAMYLGYRQ